MSYTKHEFQSGEKLYASELNEMDEQIYKNSQEIDNVKDSLGEEERTDNVTLTYYGNGYWSGKLYNTINLVSKDYAHAYEFMIDDLDAEYVFTVRNFADIVDYYITNADKQVIVIGETGTNNEFKNYTLTDFPADAKYILFTTRITNDPVSVVKKYTKNILKDIESDVTVIKNTMFNKGDVNVKLNKLDGYAYWKTSNNKAQSNPVSGEYYCYYCDVKSGKTYNLNYRFYTYTVPWMLVDDDYNIILKSNVTSGDNTEEHIEDITVPLSATKLLITGNIKFKPVLKEKKNDVLKLVLQPNIITVKQDGTGDFKTLRSAVESVSDAEPITNPYVIEVHEGIYNVFDDYTDEEILSAGTEHYTDTSFVGLKLTDGISLKGVGTKENIVIHGEVPATYEVALRNNLSTLNLQGTSTLENVTVSAKNIRYSVHDDFSADRADRTVKNCNFKAEALTSGTPTRSYGMGQRPMHSAYFENCDFGQAFLWHSANEASTTHPSNITLVNCKSLYCLLTNYNHSVVNQVCLNNCSFDETDVSSVDGTVSGLQMELKGIGTDTMLKCPIGFIYEINSVTKFPKRSDGSLVVGQLIKATNEMYWSGGSVSPTSNKDLAYGVIVGVTDDYYYVQKNGYINADTLNLSGLSVGDYVTVDSNGVIITGGTAENAIGIVTRIENKNNVPFIKLLLK